MLLDFTELYEKYDLKITGVIHAGAQLADEARSYADKGIGNVWWIEANPNVMRKLRQNIAPYGHHLIQALLTDEDGVETQFNITNYDGMSSSIFEFGELHLNSSPDTKFVDRVVMRSRTLDTVVRENEIRECNFLNMDLQGAEVLVLQGATETIKSLDYIYTEVNIGEVYIGCGKMHEIDEILTDFQRVETSMTPAQWGDAFFVRKELL